MFFFSNKYLVFPNIGLSLRTLLSNTQSSYMIKTGQHNELSSSTRELLVLKRWWYQKIHTFGFSNVYT
jgi:hypothetical protein